MCSILSSNARLSGFSSNISIKSIIYPKIKPISSISDKISKIPFFRSSMGHHAWKPRKNLEISPISAVLGLFSSKYRVFRRFDVKYAISRFVPFRAKYGAFSHFQAQHEVHPLLSTNNRICIISSHLAAADRKKHWHLVALVQKALLGMHIPYVKPKFTKSAFLDTFGHLLYVVMGFIISRYKGFTNWIKKEDILKLSSFQQQMR